MWGHLLGSIFGPIFVIFGLFALGVYLATSYAPRLGLAAMVITVLGSALFLPLQGVATFAAPEEGQAVLAGLEEFEPPPPHLRQYCARANRSGGHLARVRGQHPRGLSGLALSDATQGGRSPLGWGARADVLESDVRTDDRPLEHTAYGAVGGAGGNDKWGVDGLERASRILRPSGESSVPAEGAITPF